MRVKTQFLLPLALIIWLCGVSAAYTASIISEYPLIAAVRWQLLSPDHDGGVVIGEILEVKPVRNENGIADGIIRLKSSEVIGGSLKAGEVQIEYSRVRPPRPITFIVWDYIEPRVGMHIVAALTKQAPSVYTAETAYPLDATAEPFLQAYRQIASLLQIRDEQARVTAIERMDLKAQSVAVQLFMLEQVSYFEKSARAYEYFAPVFTGSNYDEYVRFWAGHHIQRLLAYLTDTERVQAVDTLLQGLRDQNSKVRSAALSNLLYLGARDDPQHGSLVVNLRVIKAVDALLANEKEPQIRSQALKVKEHFQKVLKQIADAAPDVPTQNKNR